MHRPLFRRHAGQRLAIEEHLALVRLIEAGDHAQDCRLAAAGRPEQGEELTRLDIERDILHRFQPAKTAGYLANFEKGHDEALSCLAKFHYTHHPRAAYPRVAQSTVIASG